MSYQVLARKWRPKTFTEVVGQKHVTQALINALEQQRLHHAYLFTGTRGIGKTTLARILAKCLNCETGVTANPCGKCSACQEIDGGRFIDLIEVDAASRTKVEDTRELLDNVQYSPTRGRYKIYLIDEVHMLSGHSFNALLKTLEEPPEHVKFLLATTDPQKLPVTVLSRCLQFNLKNLAPELISAHLEKVLQQEQIKYELPALQHLARAADGSIRDSLSLLDQAIAYGNNNITTAEVNTMLGSIETTHLISILKALAENDANKILTIIQNLAEHAADFGTALEELLLLLHQIALAQIAKTDCDESLCNLFTPEEIQLYYQIALIGRRDFPLAITPKTGFEMIMLRMLAFRPVKNPENKKTINKDAINQDAINPDAINRVSTDTWHEILPKLEISESTRALAAHCSLEKQTDNEITLLLDQKHAPALHSKHQQRLTEAFNKLFNKPMQVTINTGTVTETPNDIKIRNDNAKKEQAKKTIAEDENVKDIINNFDATLVPNSVMHNGED